MTVIRDGVPYATGYEYDDLYRLKRVVYPHVPDRSFAGQTHAFGYDTIGNRTMMQVTDQATGTLLNDITYGYEPVGGTGLHSQLMTTVNDAVNGTHLLYSYNNAGDLTGKLTTYGDGATLPETYAYDTLGRMTTYTRGEPPFEEEIFRNYYDFNGNRIYVSRENSMGTVDFLRRYLYAGEDILFYERPLGPVNYEDHVHVFHGPGIDEPLLTSHYQISPHFARHVHYAIGSDALGSVTGWYDANSGRVGILDYDAWGGLAYNTAFLPLDLTYGYTGREFFTEDYYYYRARYYEPETGRFLQVDPMIEEIPVSTHLLNVNAYAYVNLNPIIYKDPFGLEACSQSQKMIEWQQLQQAYWNAVVPKICIRTCHTWTNIVITALQNVERCCWCVNDILRESYIAYGSPGWDWSMQHSAVSVWEKDKTYKTGFVFDPYPFGIPKYYGYRGWARKYFWLWKEYPPTCDLDTGQKLK